MMQPIVDQILWPLWIVGPFSLVAPASPPNTVCPKYRLTTNCGEKYLPKFKGCIAKWDPAVNARLFAIAFQPVDELVVLGVVLPHPALAVQLLRRPLGGSSWTWASARVPQTRRQGTPKWVTCLAFMNSATSKNLPHEQVQHLSHSTP